MGSRTKNSSYFAFGYVLVLWTLAMVKGKRLEILSHSKLFDDDVRVLQEDVYDSLAENQYVIQLHDDTTNVAETVQKLIEETGGTIKHIYTNVFKGAAITNMTEIGMLMLLNYSQVTSAARVSPKKKTFNLIVSHISSQSTKMYPLLLPLLLYIEFEGHI